jgi:hypothetical protein
VSRTMGGAIANVCQTKPILHCDIPDNRRPAGLKLAPAGMSRVSDICGHLGDDENSAGDPLNSPCDGRRRDSAPTIKDRRRRFREAPGRREFWNLHWDSAGERRTM